MSIGNAGSTALHGIRFLAAGLVVCGAACIGTIENPAGPGEPDQWTVNITLTNVGDASGSVAVEPSAGTVAEPCPAPFLPGRTCRVVIEHVQPIGHVVLTSDPGDGSEFSGYGGACTGTEPECRVEIPRESSVSIRIDVAFVVALGTHATRTR